MSSTLSLVLGTRPEIIKLSPIVRACQRQDVPFSIIHTGQHYSDGLDTVFFEQLGLPTPDYDLAVGSGSHGEQTGRMITEIESVLADELPDVVLVQGDTNSVLAGTIAAAKLDGVDVGHVEAGLRSFNRSMPEETNRRLADHGADYLFAPTETASDQLMAEGVPAERITVTGNTIVDAVEQNVSIAREQSSVLTDLSIDGQYALLTAHRAENVDDPDRFKSLLESVARAASIHSLDVVYPIHPRAEKRLEEFELEVPARIDVVAPLDFLDFLLLEEEARIVFTDSGGVQEECCILQTPCITLRNETERPETVDVGANKVVGSDPESVVEGVRQMLAGKTDWENPFGDGTAAEQVIDELQPAQ